MRKPLCWFAGVVLLAIFAGCDREDGGKVSAINTERPTRSAALVEAETPQRRDVSEYRSETAHVLAENQVEVLAKGTGHCLAVMVEEGDRVSEGDILAELDKDEMQAQVTQSRVNVAQQKSTYDRAEWGLREGITPKADRDNAKYTYEQAVATLEMQQVQLSFLTIRAPISGIVTKRQLQEGMLVTSGMPVFNIVDPTSYILPIQVVERDLPRLRIGQEAHVTIDSAGDRTFVAHVRRINPSVDSQNGSVKVILEFDPADHQYLRESAFARFSLVMDTHKNALVVPKDAIVEENARRFVMVARKAPPEEAETPEGDGGEAVAEQPQDADTPGNDRLVARRVEVETGLEDSDYTEIISGIEEDAMVITLGQQTVSDGDLIEVGNMEETLESRDGLTADDLLEKARAEHQKDGKPGK